MRMKKTYLIVLVVVAILLAWFFIRFILGGNEDSWIKDERGVYVKHGNPSTTPENVLAQQEAINCALDLYQQEKAKTELNSQCLGSCGDYAVDIVHVPRTSEDNLAENQCQDYRQGKVSQFIELNKQGEIVQIK